MQGRRYPRLPAPSGDPKLSKARLGALRRSDLQRAESAHISARLLAKNLQTATVAESESPVPHLAGKLPEASELADVRRQYNTVCLHAGIGYITPNDEHQGRGPPRLRRPQTWATTRPLGPHAPGCWAERGLVGVGPPVDRESRRLPHAFDAWPGEPNALDGSFRG